MTKTLIRCGLVAISILNAGVLQQIRLHACSCSVNGQVLCSRVGGCCAAFNGGLCICADTCS